MKILNQSMSTRSESTFHSFSCPLLLLLLLLVLLLSFSAAAQISSSAYPVRCNGSIAECNEAEDEEMLMESEISRRFLASSQQISYDALKRDQPACRAGKGESYSRSSGCLPPSSNSYNEGCFKYYHCRSDS